MAADQDQRGSQLFTEGKYYEALHIFQHTLAEQERTHGTTAHHPDIANTHYRIGFVQITIGELHNAFLSMSKALAIRKRTLPDTSDAIGQAYVGLGDVYKALGKYPEAMESYEHAKESYQKRATENEPNVFVASTFFKIGELFHELGDYPQARRLLRTALKDYKSLITTSRHEVIATVHSSIARVRLDQCKYSSSIRHHETALAIRKRITNTDYSTNPDIGSSYVDLADTYARQGDFPNAERCANLAIESYIEACGRDSTQLYLVNAHIALGKVYLKSGRYNKALDTFLVTLDRLNATFPLRTHHPKLADTYDHICEVYDKLCDYSLSNTFHNKAVVIRNALFEKQGKKHSSIAMGNDLACRVYCNQGKYGDALKICKESLSLREQIFSANKNSHSGIAKNYMLLAEIRILYSDYEDAGLLYNIAKGILENAHRNQKHIDLAHCTCGLANVALLQCDYKASESHYQKALAILESIQCDRQQHFEYAQIYVSMGRLREEMCNLKYANMNYERAYKMTEALGGTLHPDLPAILTSIAKVKYKIARFKKEGLKVHFEAADRFKAIHGLSLKHPTLAYSYECVALIYIDRKDYTNALEYLTKAINNYREVYGRLSETGQEVMHPDIVRCYNSLGLLHLREGKDLPSAKFYFDSSFKANKKMYASVHDHVHIAESLLMLGGYQTQTKDFKTAIHTLKNSVSMLEKICGSSKSIKIADVHSQVGLAQEGQGQLVLALKHYETALRIRDSIIEDNTEDKNTVLDLCSIGNVLMKQSEFALAYPHYNRARKMCEKLFGIQEIMKPVLANIHYNLGLISEKVSEPNMEFVRRHYAEAIELYKDISPNHLELAAVYDRVGMMKFAECNYKEAMEWHTSAMKILRDHHPDAKVIEISKCHDNMADTKYKLGNHQEALEHYQKALAVKQKVYVDITVNIEVAKSYYNIGTALERLGEVGQSLGYHVDALTMFRAVHSTRKDHPDIARTCYGIGLALANQRDFEQAYHYFTDAMKLLLSYYPVVMTEEKCDGWLEVSQCYQYIGWLHFKREMFDEALDYYRYAIDMFEVNGVKHPDQALNMFHIGRVLVEQKKMTEALEQFYGAIDIWRTMFEAHPDMANSYREIGHICETQMKYNEALEHYATCYNIKKEFYAEDDRAFITCYEDLANVYRKQKKWEKSLDSLFMVLRLKKLAYGPVDHNDTADTMEDIGEMCHRNGNMAQSRHYYKEAKKMRDAITKAGKPIGFGSSERCMVM